MEQEKKQISDNKNKPCLVCGKSDFKFFKETKGYIYRKCRNCGLVFLDNDFDFKKAKSIYSGQYFKDTYKPKVEFDYFSDNEAKVAAYGRVVEKFNEFFIADNKKVLEIGCAAGYFLEAVKKAGNPRVYGLEISTEAAEYAQKNYAINMIGDKLEDVGPEYDNYFDTVALFHVIEHFIDPRQSLEKIFKILKPGGIIILEAPNISSWDVFLSKRISSYVFHAPYHLFGFNRKNIKRLVEESGFEVLRQDAYFSTWLFQLALRLKNTLGPGEKNDPMPVAKTEPDQNKNGSAISGQNRSFSGRKLFKSVMKKIFPGANMLLIARKKI